MKQEKQKKVIIIPNETIYKLAPFTKICENDHRETMLEFIYETGVEVQVENIYRTSSQELAYELVEQGFCILLYNNKMEPANLTIYLPEKLSIEQKKYLEIATSMITQCDLTVYKLDSNEAVIDYQKEASKNVEALMSYIITLPEYSVKINNNIESNKLIKQHQKNYPTTK